MSRMKNSKLFEPELDLNSEDVQLYRAGLEYNFNTFDINVSTKGLTKISHLLLKFKQVDVLYLPSNKITKIENIPQSVKEFDLNNNQITKIENLPPHIKRLWLRNNKITTIENIPDSIESLYLDRNPIKRITKQAYDILKKNKVNVLGVDIDKLEIVE